jgi:hypothetical protein
VFVDRLISKLEAFSRAASRLPHPDAERLVELATVATMRAVALELIQREPTGTREARVLELHAAASEKLAA